MSIKDTQTRERYEYTDLDGKTTVRYSDPEPVKQAVYPDFFIQWLEAKRNGDDKKANEVLDIILNKGKSNE